MMDKRVNKGGRGNKSVTPKKSYRLALDVGDIAKKISDKYENLSEINPNEAMKLIDALDSVAGENDG